MSDNIKVFVKIRPLISREIEDNLKHQWRVNNNTLYQLDSQGRDLGVTYTFDKVYSEDTNNFDVYNEVGKPIVEAAVAGFNGTLFAYGQTSSGKTYTMTGTEKSLGIIPLAVLNLFNIIKNVPHRDFVVSVSYIEIYNETVRDLLDIKKKNIKIHETHSGIIKLDVEEKVTASIEEVLEVMKIGNANRQTGSTNMNENSSRSHSLFQICIESREHVVGAEQGGGGGVTVSQLNLVDLAGSERAGQTGATGIKLKEGININKSLLSLTNVIKQLSEDPNKFINYRDSKLTLILRNSLGGNAKTSIICAITPAALEETISTLQFATRAKTIKNKPAVNAIATEATMIQKLTKDLFVLQSQLKSKQDLEVMLESKKNVEQDLQKKIANLQRFILNGFGDRPNVEVICGARRRLVPPRRMTISTLHSIEEDVPKVTKFCTPSLKYNPALVQCPTEFAPLQQTSNLSTLHEEPPRLITPPPHQTTANTSDDVIQLDSDDEEEDSDLKADSCSPYHGCHDITKTPPCVLRKKAEYYEKNFKDLVEFTDREKMYEPNVVELIERIEKSTAVTVKLQDEIEMLKSASKQKDEEIGILKNKIKNTDEEFRSLSSATAELEMQRKDFSTKLTDWEVSYETLKNKAKLREQELLSLIEEQNIKQNDDVVNMASSLCNEEKIMHLTEMPSQGEETVEQTNLLIRNMRTQLESKNQIILELETNIIDQKEQIVTLEKTSGDLLKEITIYKNKLSYLENENTELQATVSELNLTIKRQKENIDLVQKDRDSYISVIQELQIKLTNKENLPDIHISDAFLETMLANEDKIISNNDNLRNIIHSFKLALDSSRKEVDLLKSEIQKSNESGEQDLNTKAIQIDVLNGELSKLRKQICEDTLTINTLLHEKNNLAVVEQELVNKIHDVEKENHELYCLNKDNVILIETLKQDNDRLAVLEQDIKIKGVIIDNINKDNEVFQNCINKANVAIKKIQNVFYILTGEVREVPEILDNIILVFNSLNDNLNILESLALETTSQKNIANKNITELKTEIDSLETKIHEMATQTKHLNESLSKNKKEIKLLHDKNSEFLSEIEKLKCDLNSKNTEFNNLEIQLEALQETGKDRVENDFNLLKKIDQLDTKTSRLNNELTLKEDTHQDSIKNDADINYMLNKLNEELKTTRMQLSETEQRFCDSEDANEHFIENITQKLSSIIQNIRVTNKSTENSFIHESSKKQEHIHIMLDDIVDNVIMQLSVYGENEKLKNEIEKLQRNERLLNCDLKHSNILLRNLQDELKMKVTEIDSIENKTKEMKEQFLNFDVTMKEQMQFLKLENDKLKTRRLEMHDDRLPYTSAIKSKTGTATNEENVAFPTLLTICCNTIIGSINPKNCEIISMNNQSSPTENTIAESSVNTCSSCEELHLELRMIQQENISLMEDFKQLELIHEELLKEQNEVRDEIRLLIEPSNELQKKLLNHKTNLSILTATTFAENKSLKSQVKGLQHHHSRFHNVCQRDIPALRTQLNELLTILKDDSSFSETFHIDDKKYSVTNLIENSSTVSRLSNESTFDGDLMLDTNVTLTTVDTTLTGYNQTCLDLNSTLCNETVCQTTGHYTTEPNMLGSQLDMLRSDNENMYSKLEILKQENMKLKEQLIIYIDASNTKVDAPSSPISFIDCNDDILCQKCHSLTDNLLAATTEKDNIEKKYNELILEIPSTDALVHKFRVTESVLTDKVKELSEITNTLNARSAALNALQEENNFLSTQVMEHISEVDDLNNKLEKMKQENLQLLEQLNSIQKTGDQETCTNCNIKYDTKQSYTINDENNHSEVNKSLNDSHTESRHNKICSLQSEIHAGREDCQRLTEDVATIIQHLDHTNMTMDLDESANDFSDFKLANDMLPTSPLKTKCKIPNIQEACTFDLYTSEKIECLNYYLDKTGVEKGNLANELKIIEIMKLLHNSLVTKHGTEVENFLNKSKNYQETQDKLQEKIIEIECCNSKIKKDLEQKENVINTITNVITKVKENLIHINVDNVNSVDTEIQSNISQQFKEKFLTVLDEYFDLSSVSIFEQLCNKFACVLNNNEQQLVTVQNETRKLTAELESARDIVAQLKYNLSEKENECILLIAQKKRIHEINNAVTLNIIKKEEERNQFITNIYQEMIKHTLVCPEKIILNESISLPILERLLLDIINKYQINKAQTAELENCKEILEIKEKELNSLMVQNEDLQSVNNKKIEELRAKNDKINSLELKQNEMHDTLKIRLEENAENLNMITSLSDEISKLKETVTDKEKIIFSLSDKEDKATQLLHNVRNLQDEINKLKAVNEMIRSENELYASELEKSCATIKQNNIASDKMSSDILVLRESMKEATEHIEKLKQKTELLSKENVELKQDCEVKTRDCSRLEMNIKTHEKTAEIQNRMIMRLQKFKDDKTNSENLNNVIELTEKYKTLQNECESLKTALKNSFEEVASLKIAKESMQSRLTELEESGHRSRSSLDVISDATKRRRQSLHDSKRLFEENQEHKNVEAVFGSRQKPDDLFMDVDQDSGRSTPSVLGKGRDSLLSRTDHSDKEEEHSSRPSSVAASRRRRQSSHDLHRSVTPHAPSPHDLSNYVIDEMHQLTSETSRRRLTSDNDITQLKLQLTAYRQELENLKERNRELDDECETCAEYLRERDDQCLRLKKERAVLLNQIMELKTKLDTPGNPQVSTSKPSVSHVSVNTDEDWSNLHDVIVDRMSYDAEVEKNKKLMKTIEELRFTKLDLKNTIAKLQKALEKNFSRENSRELEQTKRELRSCKEELSELRVRYKELDEECDTCAKYLKEREEQCRKLKEAKAALESKLQQLQEDSHALELTKTVRKKRQTTHDMNRPETSTDQSDACTETTDDFLSLQAECDDDAQGGGDQSLRNIQRLTKMVEKLSHQKAQLEQKVKAAPSATAQPMYVATGSAIVQNQQITDVMKENQRLKNINAKLVNICKKRGKSANRENEDPCQN